MKEDMFKELRDGLLKQFRKIDKREGDIKLEIRISDALSNNAGKINGTYRTEVLWDEYKSQQGSGKDEDKQ